MSLRLSIRSFVLAGVLIAGQFGHVETLDAQVGRKGPHSFTANPASSHAGQRNIVVDNRTTKVVVPMQSVDDFMPPLTQGDREFGGNGPRVITFAELFIHNNAVYRRVFMRAHEKVAYSNSLNPLDGGLSTAEGWSQPSLVYRAPGGKTIARVVPKKIPLADYMDNDHADDLFSSTHTRSIRVRGDRRGDDIGFYTSVRVQWDTKVQVHLSGQATSPRLQKANLPRQFIVRVDKHTRGDRDFHGNGPRVVLRPYFRVNHNKIWLGAQMTATETKSDWSTGKGVVAMAFYQAPHGFRIKRVTDRSGRVINSFHPLKNIEYTDNDHQVDLFAHDVLGPVRIIGDSKGNDINRMTRAEFNRINYFLNVEVEPMN